MLAFDQPAGSNAGRFFLWLFAEKLGKRSARVAKTDMAAPGQNTP